RNEIAITRLAQTIVLQCPEQGHKLSRSRLQKSRQENMVRTETNAITAHGSARILIQRLDVIGNIATEQHAEIFNELESQPLGKPLQVLGTRDVVKWLQHCRDLVIHETLDTRDRMVTRIAAQLLVSQKDDPRFHNIVTGRQ